jgi:hypothetical protein
VIRLTVPAILLLTGCRAGGPPGELAEVRAVADDLLRANRIRSRPIHFVLEAGESAPFWAQQEGLCPIARSRKDPGEDCESWAHHAPSQATGERQRQVNRLAYVMGTAGARTYPNGLIGFDRSFFLVHRDDRPALRCVLAHEVTHFLRRHAYLSSRAESERFAGLAEPQRRRALARLAQEQELAADRNALRMVAIAGHDPAACVRQLQEEAELDGDYAPEDPDGTHPGHRRRLAAARAYLAAGLAADLRAWKAAVIGVPAPAAPRWQWSDSDQLLTVSTQPPR